MGLDGGPPALPSMLCTRLLRPQLLALPIIDDVGAHEHPYSSTSISSLQVNLSTRKQLLHYFFLREVLDLLASALLVILSLP